MNARAAAGTDVAIVIECQAVVCIVGVSRSIYCAIDGAPGSVTQLWVFFWAFLPNVCGRGQVSEVFSRITQLESLSGACIRRQVKSN